jgi:phosphatidylglycerophosphate synthase
MTATSAAGNALVPRSASYREVVAGLAGAQKKRARGAPAYSVYVNRPVGRYLAAACYRAGLTPNAVSAVSAVFTFSAIILIAVVPPAPWLGILVWLLLAIGYAFDSADGQVARLRGGGSPAGEWLDHVLDSIKNSALHLAVLITAFLNFDLPNPAWLLVPIGFAIVAAVMFFAMILNDLLKARYAAPDRPSGKASSPLRSLLGLPTDYGVLCLSFLFLGAPPVFLVVYTLLFCAHLGYLALAAVKWYRDMGSLAESSAG